jgi:sec-independent protein translocase protein TatA
MGIGFRELLIILVIALILFGAKKLRNVGSDLGAAVRGFKKAVNEGDEEQTKQLNDLTAKDKEKDADFHEHAGASKSDSKPNA